MAIVTPKLGKGLGRKVDRPDKRDLHLPRFPHLGIGAPLPSSVDLFNSLNLPVYDQGELGSCTANAGVLYRRFLAQRFSRYSSHDQDLSRLFLYYQERLLEGNADSDGGAEVRDTFKALASVGVCPETDDPYNPANVLSAEANNSPADASAAGVYKIGAYHRIPMSSDMEIARSCLASGYPIELGFMVYESFESIGSDGVMPTPKIGEQELGGHAVVIFGYDDTRKWFVVRNSWGPEWGAGGDFYMPYAFLQNQDMSQPDLWMSHLGRPWTS
jgi:C1A family cysteine protease